jgi:hypothetical protein
MGGTHDAVLVSIKETLMSNRTDSIVTKSASTVKGVKARFDKLVGVFKMLAEQHGAVSALMRRLQDRPEKKPDLWPEIRRELLTHERRELCAVYPVLRERGDMRLLVEQHAQEASEMESLIDEIDAAQAEDWRPLYDQLVDAVRRHVELEETKIFPKAQQVIGDQVAKALESKFLAAKNSAADLLASFPPT